MPLYFGCEGAAKEISALYAGDSGAQRTVGNLYAGIEGAAKELLPQVSIKTWKRIQTTVSTNVNYSKSLTRGTKIYIGSEIYYDGSNYVLCGDVAEVTASTFESKYFGMYVFPAGTNNIYFLGTSKEVYKIVNSRDMYSYGVTSWRDKISNSLYQSECETVTAVEGTYPDDGTLDGYYYVLQD